jgi:exodeoxyribonuclease-3
MNIKKNGIMIIGVQPIGIKTNRSSNMKCISFNVNGIRAILKKDFIKDFINFDADIFSLNETKFSEESHIFFPYENTNYFIYWTNSKLRKGYSGVAVYTKKEPLSVHYGLENNKYDDEGRVITLEFENFYYVACYVPNAGDELKRLSFRMEFEIDMLKYLLDLKAKKPVIYAGDLNVAHNEIDLKNPKENRFNPGFTDEERNRMSILLNNGFIDTFRYLNPTEIKYSWWSYRFNARLRNAGWRIDYYIVSDDIKDKLISSNIHNDVYGSDHCPVSLEIDIEY